MMLKKIRSSWLKFKNRKVIKRENDFLIDWELHLLLSAMNHPTYIRGYSISLRRKEDPSQLGLSFSAYGSTDGRGFLVLRYTLFQETDWALKHIKDVREMTSWTDVEYEVGNVDVTLGSTCKTAKQHTVMGYFKESEYSQFKLAMELYKILGELDENCSA